MTQKTVYYKDEINDDFAGTNIKPFQIDVSYKYIKNNPIWRFLSTILYYIVAVPLVWFYMRIILGVRFVNGKAPRRLGAPCYLYGNHTGYIDAFTPNLLSLPRRNKIITAPDAVSIKGLSTIVEMFGAYPVPTTLRAMRGFVRGIEYYEKRQNITIYPEAHIWPYYNGVRDFPDASFTYPAKSGVPVFAFFTAYTKPKGPLALIRRAAITVYVSDAIYADEELTTLPEIRRSIRNKVHDFMKEASEKSTYELIRYVKLDDAEPLKETTALIK